MKLCHVEYCDFVVWSKESWVSQRIYANDDFINDAITKTVGFIKLGILPELVGRWYTRQSLECDQTSTTTTQPSSTATQPSSTATQPSSTATQPSSTATQPSSTATQTSSTTTQAVSCQQSLDKSDEQSLSMQDATDGTAGDPWCYCRKDESVDYMIGCDNPACMIQWFHLSCLHLTLEQVPKGSWLCPDCNQLKSKPKRKKYNK